MPKREHFDTLFWPNFSSCIQKASEINVKNLTNMYNKKVWKKIIKVISDKKCIHFHGNEAYKYASSYEISRFLKLQTRLPWQRQPFRKKNWGRFPYKYFILNFHTKNLKNPWHAVPTCLEILWFLQRIAVKSE